MIYGKVKTPVITFKLDEIDLIPFNSENNKIIKTNKSTYLERDGISYPINSTDKLVLDEWNDLHVVPKSKLNKCFRQI